MTTAEDVYNAALDLMDSHEEIGDTDADYYEKAPRLINVLQLELARLEGTQITEKIESLTDELEISDDTANRVMPYGLAAQFALADKNPDMYQDYSVQYAALKRTIVLKEEDIEDKYDNLTGLSLDDF